MRVVLLERLPEELELLARIEWSPEDIKQVIDDPRNRGVIEVEFDEKAFCVGNRSFVFYRGLEKLRAVISKKHFLATDDKSVSEWRSGDEITLVYETYVLV